MFERISRARCSVPCWVLKTVFTSVPKSFCECVQKKNQDRGHFSASKYEAQIGHPSWVPNPGPRKRDPKMDLIPGPAERAFSRSCVRCFLAPPVWTRGRVVQEVSEHFEHRMPNPSQYHIDLTKIQEWTCESLVTMQPKTYPPQHRSART